jgi:hypothetical protein
MKRHIAGLGAASALAIVAPRALALPDLVASDAPPGWSYAALPRSSGDASSGSCVLQAPALPGNSTWFNGSMHNVGTTTASNTFTALYLNDVLKTLQGPYNILPTGFGLYLNYPSSLVLKGGRHTLISLADVFDNVPESNEVNNAWYRQYIWSPLALALGVPVTRSGDPLATSILYGPEYNCEGFSGTTVPGSWWYAFAVVGTVADSDFDVRLHDETPSNVPQAGFGSYTAWSDAFQDHVEAVIVNRNVAPDGTYYAGVFEWPALDGSSTGDKVVQFEASPPTYISAPGVYGPFTMGAGDIIDLHEIFADRAPRRGREPRDEPHRHDRARAGEPLGQRRLRGLQPCRVLRDHVGHHGGVPLPRPGRVQARLLGPAEVLHVQHRGLTVSEPPGERDRAGLERTDRPAQRAGRGGRGHAPAEPERRPGHHVVQLHGGQRRPRHGEPRLVDSPLRR